MKAVGIKRLKDKLSTYLKFVRQGEIVLVTDRDVVIAEIRRPLRSQRAEGSKLDAYLNEASERGELRLPSQDDLFPKSKSDLPKLFGKVDITKLLQEARENRF